MLLRLSVLIGYKAASEVGAKLATLAVAVLAARALPPEAFGLFALAWTLGWLLGVVTDAGFQLHLAREVARAPDAAPAIVRPTAALRAGGAGLALVAAMPAAVALGGREGWAFWGLVAAQLASAVVEFFNHAYRGLMRSDIESSLNLAQRIGMVALASLALLWRPSLASLALALAVPAVATLVASLLILRRLGVFEPGQSVPGGRAGARAIVRDAWPIGAGIVLSALYFRVDVFLIDAWIGTDAVAHYNAVFRLVEALRLVPAAVLAVVFPLLCRTGSCRPVVVVASGLGIAGLAAAGLAWMAGPWLVPVLYGAGYLPAVPVFQVLVWAVPLFFVNYALTHQLLGWQAQGRYAAIAAMALAANLAANAVLLPTLGTAGAAWATLVTELVVTAGCAVSLARMADGRRLPARLVAPAVS